MPPTKRQQTTICKYVSALISSLTINAILSQNVTALLKGSSKYLTFKVSDQIAPLFCVCLAGSPSFQVLLLVKIRIELMNY